MIISLVDDVDMGLRDEQRELTRRTVLDAVLKLVAEGSLDELSVPAVARRSGVSLATIYRHFPTRDELLAAAAAEPSRQALAARSTPRPGDDDLAGYQRAMWTSFAANLGLLRHQITSQAGRDMRQARLSQSRARLAAYIAGRGVDAESAEGQRLISLLLLVSGSLALVELHDRQGLTIDDPSMLRCGPWTCSSRVSARLIPLGRQLSHKLSHKLTENTEEVTSMSSSSPSVEFTAPGPGGWMLLADHFPGALTPEYQRIYAETAPAGMADYMARYGVLAKGIDVGFVHGHLYIAPVPLAGPREMRRTPPSAAVWLMARLHPAFRRRARAA